MEQSPKAVLVVVCGVPASGKSHLCGELRKILVGEKENPIVFVVSYDVIIPLVTPDQWKSQRRDLLQAISLLIRTHRGCDGESFRGKNDEEQRSTKMAAMILQENAHSSPSSNPLIVILDDNMYYRSMRYEVYQLAAALETGFCQIFLEIEPEIAKRRNERRSSPVPERVMDRIDRLMEGPDVKKNKFERYSHLLDCPWEETGLEAVVGLIERALKVG
jgi:O-phosphoseryl-tRNA(Sec) kinase